MSAEIVNLFTSNENIKYLKDYLYNNIDDINARDIVLDNIVENVFDFPNHELLDNSKQRLRHSVNVWEEVRLLNKAFIDDRVSYANEINDFGKESYGMNMFIEDSLQPKGYEHFNDPHVGFYEEPNSRIFRYQDPDDINKSAIPVWQKNNKRSMYTDNIDELKDSEYSQIRKNNNVVINNTIETTSNNNCKKIQWIDI